MKRIILCLDAGSPGQEAAKKLKAEYEQKGYQVSTRTPPLYKDWNEYLQYQVRKMAIKSPKATNFEQIVLHIFVILPIQMILHRGFAGSE